MGKVGKMVEIKGKNKKSNNINQLCNFFCDLKDMNKKRKKVKSITNTKNDKSHSSNIKRMKQMEKRQFKVVNGKM